MEGKFKCCKTSEFRNFCCVTCTEVFHPSCLERKAKYVKLSAHKVYCSLECQTREQEKMNELELLQEEIEKLKKENKAKDNYIKRLKRGSKVFEESVSAIEQDYIEQLKKQNGDIENLNSKIITLQNENGKMMEELEDNKQVIERLGNDLDEIRKISRQMVDTIRSLELDNELYLTEINNLKLKPAMKSIEVQWSDESVLINDSANDDSLDRSNVNYEHKNKSSNRVLVLGDENLYHFKNMLLKTLKNFKTQVIIKPHALFEQVIDDIVNLTQSFTLSDYVLVLPGTSNILKGRLPSLKTLHSRLRYCSHTNFIFMSIPYFPTIPNLHNLIYSFNVRLNKYLCGINRYSEGNISFMDINSMGFVMYQSKIANLVLEHVTNTSNKNKNLKFIKLDNGISDMTNSPHEYASETVDELLIQSPTGNEDITDASNIDTGNSEHFL